MIYFRADCNSVIASGHIMRCISIAQGFIESGYKVKFLVADNNPTEILDRYNIQYTVLESQWDNLNKEINKVISIVKGDSKSLVIIDSYYVSKEYVNRLSNYSAICYLGSLREYLGNLSALINYSTSIDYDFYKVYNSRTQLLLGPQYAPLRKEFSFVTDHITENLNKILITTGGTDGLNFTSLLLKRICNDHTFSDITFYVIIGKMFNNKEELYKFYGKDKNIILLENVTSMSSVMKEVDLAVSANGTTVYELSATKVPTITFCVAEEQLHSAEGLHRMGVVDYCGEAYRDINKVINNITSRIIYYKSNPKERQNLAKKAHSFIDGMGVKRIVESLERFH